MFQGICLIGRCFSFAHFKERDKRNSLNHFGYQKKGSAENVPTYLDLQDGLKEIYNAFVNIIAKTCTGKNADGEKVDINSWKE